MKSSDKLERMLKIIFGEKKGGKEFENLMVEFSAKRLKRKVDLMLEEKRKEKKKKERIKKQLILF